MAGDDPKKPDVTSDPARNDEEGQSWVTEGGATATGPATDTDAADTVDPDQPEASDDPSENL